MPGQEREDLLPAPGALQRSEVIKGTGSSELAPHVHDVPCPESSCRERRSRTSHAGPDRLLGPQHMLLIIRGGSRKTKADYSVSRLPGI